MGNFFIIFYLQNNPKDEKIRQEALKDVREGYQKGYITDKDLNQLSKRDRDDIISGKFVISPKKPTETVNVPQEKIKTEEPKVEQQVEKPDKITAEKSVKPSDSKPENQKKEQSLEDIAKDIQKFLNSPPGKDREKQMQDIVHRTVQKLKGLSDKELFEVIDKYKPKTKTEQIKEAIMPYVKGEKKTLDPKDPNAVYYKYRELQNGEETINFKGYIDKRDLERIKQREEAHKIIYDTAMKIGVAREKKKSEEDERKLNREYEDFVKNYYGKRN